MTNVLINAFFVDALPVVTVTFKKGMEPKEIFEATYQVIEELCGKAIPLPLCKSGHPQFGFTNGSSACTQFTTEDGCPCLRMMFHRPPPPECALMLLLKTPGDRKGMN